MSNVTLTLPDPSDYISNHTLDIAIAIVLLVAAILASVAVEVYRRHYNAKKQAQLAKHWVAVWLTASSGVFTALGYIAVLLQNNSGYLSTLPFVGKHVLAVVGLAYFLYNIRLSSWYKKIAAALTKWTGTKVAAVVSPTVALDSSDEAPSNFVVQ